mgnify:CR=1 FL=1
MTVDDMNELTTKLAVQEQKLEVILETTKEIQSVVVNMQENLNLLNKKNAVQDEKIIIHERKIEHLESKIEKNSNDIARLEANASSALRTSRWIGAIFVTIATLSISVLGLLFR